jgi:hypothetical protein
LFGVIVSVVLMACITQTWCLVVLPVGFLTLSYSHVVANEAIAEHRRYELVLYSSELDAVMNHHKSISDPASRQAYVTERKTFVKAVIEAYAYSSC